MAALAIAPPSPAEGLRLARRQWLETGTLTDGLVAPELSTRWARSRAHGLVPDGRQEGTPHASAAQLARTLEHRHQLVAHAKPVMAFLNEQIRNSDSIVLLADPHGMLLHGLGDLGFADRAARVALRPGAIWSEQWRGTNAIGTALVEQTEVVVHAAEHYLARNSFLTCAAAPIADASGQLVGVLDISGDRRGYHRHTLGLVRSGARLIEHQLFQALETPHLRVQLHEQIEGLGTITEGLLSLSETGLIVGASTAALQLLRLPRTAIGTALIEQVLSADVAALMNTASTPPRRALRVQRRDGATLWARAHADAARPRPRAAPGVSVVPPARVDDALATLDTGDPVMHEAIARARRILTKPIAVLLQGESGVGKEVFARAMHRSGPRRDQPFVAVNCAALPEALIESELFGYRPGAFTGASRDGAIGRIREAHGGTLFLDEIGDMPASMQARLLRVLQDRQVAPLGSGKPIAVDFQLVCATHRKLGQEVDAGRFREDLFYRVNGLSLLLPSFRDRTDQATLTRQVLRELEPGRPLQLAQDLMVAFAAYRWPGNLRQLVNVLRTACALLEPGESVLDWQHLADDMIEQLRRPASRPVQACVSGALRSQAQHSIQEALQACAGNMSEAARRLGISRNTLYRKCRELSLG